MGPTAKLELAQTVAGAQSSSDMGFCCYLFCLSVLFSSDHVDWKIRNMWFLKRKKKKESILGWTPGMVETLRSHSGLYFVTRLASHVSRHVSLRLTRVLVPEAPPALQPRALLPSALFTSEGHLHPREQLMQTVGTCNLHAVHGDEDLTSGG